jgi:hypothetical protein
MVIFPEYVFAHAVLELKMALDDYLLMAVSGLYPSLTSLTTI